MNIYVITHKKFNRKYIQGKKIYKPLLVGVDCGNKGEEIYLSDNKGENISYKNKSYCELTGIYWIWKNSSEDIVGIDHYRRYFVKNRLTKSLLTENDISNALAQNDIVLPKKDPTIYNGETAADFFGDCHDPAVWNLIENTIKEMYPAYVKDFNWYSKQTTGYCYNMFIAHAELINQYNEWLFSILQEIESKVDFEKYDSYNQRMIGFIAERLINIWVHHNNLKAKEYPVWYTEKIGLIPKVKNELHKALIKRRLRKNTQV